MKSLAYSMDLALSNKYLEVVIQRLETKIFNEKLAVLFDFLFIRTKPQVSQLIS